MSGQGEDDSNSVVSISIIKPEDVSALVRVHSAAFKTDQISNLMLLNREENTHEALMLKSIQHWMSDPTAKLMQAVDADGQVLGWACWIVKEAKSSNTDASTDAAAPKPDVGPGRTQATLSKTEDGEVRKSAPPAEAQPVKERQIPQDPARVLGGLMHKDMVGWEERYLAGKRYAVLQALATDPRHQSRGIATKLVQRGLEEVDAAGLPCWIHASPASYRLYERAGFEEVGNSDYDLDEWAPGGESGNRGWGRYTFRYMLRPETIHV